MGNNLISSVIFDFDGTLVDSEEGIKFCFTKITKQLAPDKVKILPNIKIGPPLLETAALILGPEHKDKLDIFVRMFIELHDNEIIKNIKPFEGINELLEKLTLNQIPLAIATNKRKEPTKKIINFLNWQKYFKIIICSNTDNKINKKSNMIEKIIQLDSFKNSCYIGDMKSDYTAAKINNIEFIWAAYGYGCEQDWNDDELILSINTPNDILRMILNEKK
jgi:phosphoglycolate phosphatase